MSFPVVLFDIDGTLTEPRRVITKDVIEILNELAKLVEIGFVTGSDLEYVKEQMWPAFERKIIRDNCHILPCNGTQYFIPGETPGTFKAVYRTDMYTAIGHEKFQKVMKALVKFQNRASELDDLPLTGHFIQNRGSMINWCPIGRNAVNGDRQQFIAIDSLYNVRRDYLMFLRDELLQSGVDNVTIKLGGSTSFDIYPKGWDKTYALKHFSDQTEFWFIGDKCQPNGNDYEIFSLLREERRAFQVESYRDTIELVEELIETEFRRYE